jgi:exodeoxyribonuclease VII small subunit
MSKDLTYTQAIEELEAIVNEIESEDISIDQLSEKVKQASRLIRICQDALKTTSEEVRDILDSLNKENQQAK